MFADFSAAEDDAEHREQEQRIRNATAAIEKVCVFLLFVRTNIFALSRFFILFEVRRIRACHEVFERFTSFSSSMRHNLPK